MNLIFKAFSKLFFTVFRVLDKLKDVYTLEYENVENKSNPDPNSDVKTNMKYEWTENKNIKITLEIIIGSNGLGVFMMPNIFQKAPEQPPAAPEPTPPLPQEPVLPTIDEFYVDVDFDDIENNDTIVLSKSDDVNNDTIVLSKSDDDIYNIAEPKEVNSVLEAKEELPIEQLSGEKDIMNLIDIINQLNKKINEFGLDDLEFEDMPALIDISDDNSEEYNDVDMEIRSVD